MVTIQKSGADLPLETQAAEAISLTVHFVPTDTHRGKKLRRKTRCTKTGALEVVQEYDVLQKSGSKTSDSRV
jgi:phage gp16-like protein